MFSSFFTPPVRVHPKLSLVFNPSAWNADDAVDNANCLAYALDEPSLGFPFIDDFRNRKETKNPILKFQRFREDLHPRYGKYKDSYERAYTVFKWANLTRILEHAANPQQHHIIAFSAKWGHFWRLDGDKIWSHKIGWFPATNKDATGSLLKRLEGCTLYDAFMISQLSKSAMQARGVPVLRSEDIAYFTLPKKGLLVVPKPRNKNPSIWA